jgi:Predicted AAA-ATPase/PD-(D/E)XK nuclease superfamily
MMDLPIGYDNFGDVIDQGLTFVDKSLLIKKFLDDKGAQVILITRPRRFGKTINLSMLHHFFAANVYGKPTKELFAGLKIMQQSSQYLQHQGNYPVAALSFKDVKDGEFKSAYSNLARLLSRTYKEHISVLESPKLTSEQKYSFEAILKGKADESQVRSSLLDLTDCLYQHYGKKAILLIDEYDTPIQSGYAHGYYDKVIEVMRHLFSASLKSNPYLYRAVLTGILRIARESLFSGLNNLEVYSLLRSEYSQYFGFTEEEVVELLKESGLEIKLEEIRGWYNGYQMGNTVVYNPWSIVNCIKRKGLLQPYWVNTSDNALVKNLLIQSSTKFKHEFELLLEGKVVEKFIDENFVFPELKANEGAIWSLLLMTGYLKVVSSQETLQGTLCQLEIPNQEIRNLYRKIIELWLSNGKGIEWYNEFLKHLLTGNVEGFKDSLSNILLQTISVHDLSREPEAFYQGLMIGLTASLDKRDYEKKSNREGYGRYDIVIIPRDINKLAIILELKSVKAPKKEENLKLLLQQDAKEALIQIDKNAYSSELKQRGIKNVLKMGLAFCGKDFYIEPKHEPSSDLQ